MKTIDYILLFILVKFAIIFTIVGYFMPEKSFLNMVLIFWLISMCLFAAYLVYDFNKLKNE